MVCKCNNDSDTSHILNIPAIRNVAFCNLWTKWTNNNFETFLLMMEIINLSKKCKRFHWKLILWVISKTTFHFIYTASSPVKLGLFEKYINFYILYSEIDYWKEKLIGFYPKILPKLSFQRMNTIWKQLNISCYFFKSLLKFSKINLVQ